MTAQGIVAQEMVAQGLGTQAASVSIQSGGVPGQEPVLHGAGSAAEQVRVPLVLHFRFYYLGFIFACTDKAWTCARVCRKGMVAHLQLLPTSCGNCSDPLHVSQAFAATVPRPSPQPVGVPGQAPNPSPNIQSVCVPGQPASNSSGGAGQQVRDSTRTPSSKTSWVF